MSKPEISFILARVTFVVGMIWVRGMHNSAQSKRLTAMFRQGLFQQNDLAYSTPVLAKAEEWEEFLIWKVFESDLISRAKVWHTKRVAMTVKANMNDVVVLPWKSNFRYLPFLSTQPAIESIPRVGMLIRLPTHQNLFWLSCNTNHAVGIGG